jgi:cysteine synthase A
MLEPQAHIDGFLQVSDNEAIAAARRLARDEGIFAGFSSGANLAAALQLLRGPCRGKTVVILICDSGLKYLSTDLWDSW